MSYSCYMTIFHLIHLVKYMFSILPIAIEYEFCTRTQLLLLLLLWLNNLVIHRMYNPVSSWFFCGNYFTSGRKEGRKRQFFCKYFFLVLQMQVWEVSQINLVSVYISVSHRRYAIHLFFDYFFNQVNEKATNRE